MSTVITTKFRASYPNLFKPKRNDLNGKDEYSVVALFPKGADLANLKAAAQKAIEDKWGTDKKKWPTNLRSPFRDQGEKAKVDEATGKKMLPEGHEEGAIFLNLKTTQRPGLVDQEKQDIIDTSKIYPGVWLRAAVNFFAYDQKGNRGVSIGLQHIQLVADGDPLGGRVRAQDAFAPVEMPGSGGHAADPNSLFS